MQTYYSPTKVISSEECVNQNAQLFASMGKKALIVTGRFSAKKNGSFDDVTAVLKNNGQSYVLYDKVMSNPTIDCAYEGAELARTEHVDFVIGIGGGSPMDAAKAMALLAAQDISRETLFSGKYQDHVLPMIFIPTTAGTGSEVTQYSILTNDELETKSSIATPLIFPKIAMLDPKYMMGLSKEITVNTAIDALSHAVEGILSIRANTFTDALAKESISLIASCIDAMKQGEFSLEERMILLQASTLAGMVIANTGTTAVHAMGYSLTYFKHIDHGRANGLLMGTFLSYLEDQCPTRVSLILESMGLSNTEKFSAILDDLLGEKEKLTEEELKKYTSIAYKAKNIGNCFVVPTEDDIFGIFEKSFS